MDGAALFVQPSHLTQTGSAVNLLKQQQTNGQMIEQHVPDIKPSYNHPKLSAIMAHLEYEYNEYKYTVYRCACKCVTLQKVFFTSNIPFKLILAVMERHGLQDAEGNLMVPPFQLTSLIHDIYFAFEKLGHYSKTSSYDLETATAVLSDFFWNIFDPHRRHSISLLEIKVTFLLLSKLYSSDQLVSEFYNIFASKKTKCVSKFNFEYLLSILTKFFTYIGEGSAYGAHNIQIVLEQCFSRCHNPIGLTEYQFHCLWTTTQTRFLIYANLIALIKRIEDTEKLIHNNVCASCHSERIVGIRFKCQTCRNLSLCLKCFATGYSTNKHESGHRMFECFTEDLPPKKFTHFFAKLCTLFCVEKRNSSEEETKGFCNVNDTSNVNETELVTIRTNRSSNASTVSAGATSNLNTPKLETPPIQKDIKEAIEPSLVGLTATASNASQVSERLQSLIDRLLLQNSKLEQQLRCVKNSSPEEIAAFLQSHQKFLKEIIDEMRNFSDVSRSVSSYPTSSTPNRSTFGKKTIMLDNMVGPQSNTSNLTNSINGADINRSYLDANKSDYSINDLSLWFNQKRHNSLSPSLNSYQKRSRNLGILEEVTNAMEQAHAAASIIDSEMRDTEMANFKLLLNKVKEIVEDSYSDNTELSEATQNLENVLDSIIKTEESRRHIQI